MILFNRIISRSTLCDAGQTKKLSHSRDRVNTYHKKTKQQSESERLRNAEIFDLIQYRCHNAH